MLEIVRAAIAGGATMIQVREKESSTRAFVALGQAIHAITRAAGVPLIINDRVDVALAIEAEGVHVGQDDMPAALVRQLVGPQRLVGVSAETVAQARQAEEDGADYLGVGPVFATPSKADAGAPIGLEGLATIAQATTLPIVAIGGISHDNAAAVLQAGAWGLAVISAIMSAADPEAAARRLRMLQQQEQSERS